MNGKGQWLSQDTNFPRDLRVVEFIPDIYVTGCEVISMMWQHMIFVAASFRGERKRAYLRLQPISKITTDQT